VCTSARRQSAGLGLAARNVHAFAKNVVEFFGCKILFSEKKSVKKWLQIFGCKNQT
jgi:hypothetical protein